MDNRGEVWKAILIMIPTLGATLIAVSRIMDARHHPFDVITGSMLGVLCAYLSYRQYFPPITEAWKKGRAYPIRTWASEPKVPPDAASRYGTTFDESTDALRNPEEEGFEATRVTARYQSTTTTGTARNPQTYHLQSNNPFADNEYNRSDLNNDRVWSSSSEDLADSYEMRRGYTRTQNPGALNSQVPGYEIDTAYPPQTEGVNVDVHRSETLHTASDVMMNQSERGRSLTQAV